jgi:hypothetical protein
MSLADMSHTADSCLIDCFRSRQAAALNEGFKEGLSRTLGLFVAVTITLTDLPNRS